jgi:hypothetical protein
LEEAAIIEMVFTRIQAIDGHRTATGTERGLYVITEAIDNLMTVHFPSETGHYALQRREENGDYFFVQKEVERKARRRISFAETGVPI